MKGLLYKDMCNLKQQLKMYVLVMAVWLIVGIANKDPYFFGGLVMMFTLLVPMSSISYDEKAKWDRYALTMPVSTTDIVLSKYVLALICAVIGGIISIGVGMCIANDIGEIILSTGVLMMLGLCITSIILPLIFKFGVEKSRLLLMLVFLVPSIIIIFATRFAGLTIDDDILMKILYLSPFAAVLLISMSALISINIYKKKEF